MSIKLDRTYVEVTIQDWNDFFKLHQRFLSRFVFRGQANAEWELQSSLERLVQRLHPNYIERMLPALYEGDMLKEFEWKYPLYGKRNIPRKDECIEWLALMQHYGSPTRMLDFSHSPFVALFMAIDGASYDKSSVWAINKTVLQTKMFEYFRADFNTNISHGDQLKDYTYKRANETVGQRMRTKIFDNDLFLIEPHYTNERLNRQQGLFVVPANIQSSFKSNLEPYLTETESLKKKINELIEYSNSASGIRSQSDITLLKINIPKHLNLEITRLLKQMNITSETMYPGIEGLARSMSSLRHAIGGYNQ